MGLEGEATGSCNFHDRGLKVIEHLSVGNVQADEAVRCEDRITFGVGGFEVLMDFAIHVHDNISSVAIEIYNEANNDLLPLKVETVNLIIPQPLP